MKEQPGNNSKRKVFSRIKLVLAAVVLLGILYFLQKSGCRLLRSQEKIEWLER